MSKQCQALVVVYINSGRGSKITRPGDRCDASATVGADGHCLCWVHRKVLEDRTRPLQVVAHEAS